MTLATERDHLAAAEQDVLQGEQRIAAQVELVGKMKRDGHDTEQAQRLLETLEQTLGAWRDHRDEIRRIIGRLEREQG